MTVLLGIVYISVQTVRGNELIDLLFTDSIPQTTGIIYTDFPYTVKPLNNGHLANFGAILLLYRGCTLGRV